MATSCSYITHEYMESLVRKNASRYDHEQDLLKRNSSQKKVTKDDKLPKEGDDKKLDAPLDYSG